MAPPHYLGRGEPPLLPLQSPPCVQRSVGLREYSSGGWAEKGFQRFGLALPEHHGDVELLEVLVERPPPEVHPLRPDEFPDVGLQLRRGQGAESLAHPAEAVLRREAALHRLPVLFDETP